MSIPSISPETYTHIYGISGLVITILIPVFSIMRRKFIQHTKKRQDEHKEFEYNITHASDMIKSTYFTQQIIHRSMVTVLWAIWTATITIISLQSIMIGLESTYLLISFIISYFCTARSAMKIHSLTRNHFLSYYTKQPNKVIPPADSADTRDQITE